MLFCFVQGLESMHVVAQKCINLKPTSSPHKLMKLLDGIIGENTEVLYWHKTILLHWTIINDPSHISFIQVVLAECSRSFGPWWATTLYCMFTDVNFWSTPHTNGIYFSGGRMIAHATELLTAGSVQAEILLKEERDNLGGISIEESHRLVYAQVLSSHALTWQVSAFWS